MGRNSGAGSLAARCASKPATARRRRANVLRQLRLSKQRSTKVVARPCNQIKSHPINIKARLTKAGFSLSGRSVEALWKRRTPYPGGTHHTADLSEPNALALLDRQATPSKNPNES